MKLPWCLGDITVPETKSKKTSNVEKFADPKGPQTKARKEYTCRKCQQPMTTAGHTQFRGSRYCPIGNPVSKEEWLKEKRAAIKTKTGDGSKWIILFVL